MIKIKFECPECKAKTCINEVADFNVTTSTPVVGLSVVIGSQKNSEFLFDSNVCTKDEEEVDRDFVEVRAYACSECGQYILDDDGREISDATELAKFLESKGMLVQDSGYTQPFFPKNETSVDDTEESEIDE